MTSMRSLVGSDVVTVDDVRRRVVSIDGHRWTDEDGIETDRSTIARVIVGGQSLPVDRAVRQLTPWIED